MQAATPVVKGLEPYEIVLAENQPEYNPLHVLRTPGPTYAMLSRWVLTDEERQQIAEGADVYLTTYTFGHRFLPTAMQVMRSDVDPELVRQQMDLDTELSQRIGAMYAYQQMNAQKEGTIHEARNEGNAGTGE